MQKEQYFKAQQPKLNLEAWLKSALCGLAVGFGFNFLAATILWFAPIKGLWMIIGLLIAVTAISTPIFYYKRFRPNNQRNARRIDRLGLEERLITMVEFENEDSYMIQAQRKDAQAALSAMDNKQLKIKVAGTLILAVVVCAVLGIGMTTVNGLSEAGVIPGGDELVEAWIREKTTEYVTVYYSAEKGGVIEGDEEQIIVKGTGAVRVTAVADEGFIFKCWSDGNPNPTREDKNLSADVVYEALFMTMDDEGASDDEGEGDEANDVPGDESSDGENNGQTAPNNPPEDESNSSAGAVEPSNQIIDGETYYRDMLEIYQDAAEELLKDSDSGLTEEQKNMIKKYLGIV